MVPDCLTPPTPRSDLQRTPPLEDFDRTPPTPPSALSPIQLRLGLSRRSEKSELRPGR